MSRIPVLMLLLTLTSTALGDCVVGEIPVMENFNMSQMAGTWYEAYWLPPFFERPDEVWYDYAEVWTLTDDPDVVTVKAHGRPINASDCGSFSKRYERTEDPNPAKWWTPRYINSSYSYPMDTWIIATDYDSYALMYGCNIVNDSSGKCESGAGWVWSRTAQLSEQNLALVTDKLDSLCFGIDDMKKMPLGKTCFDTPGTPAPTTGGEELLKCDASEEDDTSGASPSAPVSSFAVFLFTSVMCVILQ